MSLTSGEPGDAAATHLQEGSVPGEGLDALHVEHLFGPVTLHGSDSPDIHWRMRHGAPAESEAPQEIQVLAERRGGKLHLRVLVSRDDASPLSSAPTLEVEVPRRLALRCDSANGALQVDGMHARTKLRSANGGVGLRDHQGDYEITSINGPVDVARTRGEGEVRLTNGLLVAESWEGRLALKSIHGSAEIRQGRGRLRAEVSTGDLTVTDVEGNVKVQTSVGSVRLRNVRGSQVVARTHTSGDVTAEMPVLPGARIELRAATGNVQLQVPPEAEARIEMHTRSGRLSCSLPLTDVEKTPHSVAGTLRSTEAFVRLESLLGDVELGEVPHGD